MTTGASVTSLIGVILLGAGGLVLEIWETRRDTKFVSIAPELVTAPPESGTFGVVTAIARPRAGLNVLGWEPITPRWEAHVVFVPPDGCRPSADHRAVAAQACSSIPAEGRLVSAMSTSRGPTMWTVAIEVGELCYKAIELNDRWPTDRAEC